MQGHSLSAKCLLDAHMVIVHMETMPHNRFESVCGMPTMYIEPAGPKYSEYSCARHSVPVKTAGRTHVIAVDRPLRTALIVAQGMRLAILLNRKV